MSTTSSFGPWTSGKIELLSRIIPKFFATDHRVLIFFQMVKVMDIMEDSLKMMGWKYLRLDGGTKTEDRAGHIALFDAKDSDYKVFILSTRAGGLGLNLTNANKVYMMEPQFNPAAEAQAVDRVHRLGQKRPVTIMRFIMEDSFEEKMLELQRKKKALADMTLGREKASKEETTKARLQELRSLFR